MVDDPTMCLGVRRRTIVGHGGPRVALHVFCPRDLRTTYVDVCQRCPRVVAIDDASVTCTCGVDAACAGSLAGAAMGEASIGIEVSTPVAELAHLVASGGWTVVVVLDADQRALGLIPGEEVAAAPWNASAQDLLRRVRPVSESSHVLDVVQRMVRERVRALPVVDAALAVVGVVTDLDTLRWAARTRSSWPAPPEGPGAARDTKGGPPKPER